MSIYLLTFQGGQALGAAIWGVVASVWDTRVALTAVAAGLATAPLVAARRPLRTGAIDVRPSEHVTDPELAIEPDPRQGPVLVTVEYRVPHERREAFRAAMERVGRSRRRSGAERWGLWQDGADLERFVETYVVPTWEEHMRQTQERFTRSDQHYVDEARALVREGTAPEVSHLFFAYPT